MSKSLNNTISVGQLLSRTTPGQFRLFCMLRPYRQLIEYSSESLQKAVSLHDSWMSFLALGDAYVRGKVDTQAINEPLLLKTYVYGISLPYLVNVEMKFFVVLKILYFLTRSSREVLILGYVLNVYRLS